MTERTRGLFASRRAKRAKETAEEDTVTRTATVFVPPAQELESMMATGLPDAVHVRGDLDARKDLSLAGGLVVTGDLHVAPGARLDAPAEVHGDVRVGAGARLLRPVIVRGSLYLEDGATAPTCRVKGKVHLGRQARIDGELHCAALYLAEGVAQPDTDAGAEVIEVEFVRA